LVKGVVRFVGEVETGTLFVVGRKGDTVDSEVFFDVGFNAVALFRSEKKERGRQSTINLSV
jgi:hypothetical protein